MVVNRILTLPLSFLPAVAALTVPADARLRFRRLFRLPHSSILKRDLLRDRTVRPRPLRRPTTFFRYTTQQQARRELRKGLNPGTHMTAPGGPGRPLSRETARRRYGLPRTPRVRETIRLPAGTPIRPARALGGAPGYGETVTVKTSSTASRSTTPCGWSAAPLPPSVWGARPAWPPSSSPPVPRACGRSLPMPG